MKREFSDRAITSGGLLLLCSSHEERCLGVVSKWGTWRPDEVLLFHYNDANPKRETNHSLLRELIGPGTRVTEIEFTESDAVSSYRLHHKTLLDVLNRTRDRHVAIDISVFTKRHLLMTLNWLDDHGLWDRLYALYSEPEDYDAASCMPLSFGISSFEQIPGFSGTPDSSRPLQLLILLGYEGERALATFDQLQPIKTTLVVPDPPFKDDWRGRTEDFNKDLITRLGASSLVRADAIDPDAVFQTLTEILGPVSGRSDYARIISPLGTKPQTLGVYSYTRVAADPPALIYSSPLRHNQQFYSHGVGSTWILMSPKE